MAGCLARGRADHNGVLHLHGVASRRFCGAGGADGEKIDVGNRRPLLLAPVFWVAIELFRDRVIGDPWNPLGGAQIDNIPFARMAQVAGVYGLSFAVMLVNCALVAALLLRGQRRKNLWSHGGGGNSIANRSFCQTGSFAANAPSRADAGKRSVAGPAGMDPEIF